MQKGYEAFHSFFFTAVTQQIDAVGEPHFHCTITTIHSACNIFHVERIRLSWWDRNKLLTSKQQNGNLIKHFHSSPFKTHVECHQSYYICFQSNGNLFNIPVASEATSKLTKKPTRSFKNIVATSMMTANLTEKVEDVFIDFKCCKVKVPQFVRKIPRVTNPVDPQSELSSLFLE